MKGLSMKPPNHASLGREIVVSHNLIWRNPDVATANLATYAERHGEAKAIAMVATQPEYFGRLRGYNMLWWGESLERLNALKHARDYPQLVEKHQQAKLSWEREQRAFLARRDDLEREDAERLEKMRLHREVTQAPSRGRGRGRSYDNDGGISH
jgi:hypothetical protein